MAASATRSRIRRIKIRFRTADVHSLPKLGAQNVLAVNVLLRALLAEFESFLCRLELDALYVDLAAGGVQRGTQ